MAKLTKNQLIAKYPELGLSTSMKKYEMEAIIALRPAEKLKENTLKKGER